MESRRYNVWCWQEKKVRIIKVEEITIRKIKTLKIRIIKKASIKAKINISWIKIAKRNAKIRFIFKTEVSLWLGKRKIAKKNLRIKINVKIKETIIIGRDE